MSTPAVQNNNPGNLRDTSTGSFQQFKTPQEGYAALLNDLQAKQTGTTTTGLGPSSTLIDFAAKYAPSSDDNDVGSYAANLANQMGVRPDTQLKDLDLGKWAAAVAHNEDSSSLFGTQKFNPKPYSQPDANSPQFPTVTQQVPAQAVPEKPFSTPLTNIASGDSQANIDQSIGAGKGALQVIRDTSGVDTNPVMKAMIANSPAMSQALDEEKSAIQPTNFNQQKGSIQSQIGGGLIGPTEVGAGMEASRLAKVPEVAKQIASPKMTLGAVEKGLMSFGESPQVTKDAKAIEPLVQSKILKLGDSANVVQRNISNVQKEIVSSSQGLLQRLKGMEVKPTVQPEELSNLFQKSLESIKDTPRIDENVATQEATKTWNKFLSYLPQNSDIYAEDVLKARQKTDAWVESSKGGGVFDPSRETGFTTALRALRQGANDLVASKAPDQGVKDALSYQSSLYNVMENLAKKGAPAVKKAEELSNMSGLSGIVARHPIATDIVKKSVGGLLTAAGLGGAYELGKKQ